ncbi:MAG: hypothetical protein ABI988_18800 [Nitrospirota bacterium]
MNGHGALPMAANGCRLYGTPPGYPIGQDGHERTQKSPIFIQHPFGDPL